MLGRRGKTCALVLSTSTGGLHQCAVLACLPPLHHQPAPAAHLPPLVHAYAHTLHTHTGARPPCSYMRQGHRVAAAAAAASSRLRVLCLLLAALASARLPTSSAFLIRRAAPTVTLTRSLSSSTKSATFTTSMSAAPATIAAEGKKGTFKFSWQQTMLRIKDPAKSLPFYEETLGFHRLHEYKFDSFSLYFLYVPTPEEKATLPPCGTKESEKFLWSMKGTVLELTWNHGTETQADFKYNNGNEEPHRGFGHIAVACDDVYAACAELEKKGVAFQKKPDEGRMKGLAFVKDPDGYWIEVISRDPTAPAFSGPSPPPFNLAQTMLRVKDPQASLGFYRDLLGMRLLAVKHFSDFSLFFLAQPAALPPSLLPSLPFNPEDEAGWGLMKQLPGPVLELTHNHGTESQADFSYHNGNTDPRGFGHVGFLCDDLEEACVMLEKEGVAFLKQPSEGSMRGLAFAKDPDGYWVEVVGRGLTI